MSFTSTDPAEILARREKFKRRAPLVRNQVHLDKILASFPEDQRVEIFEQVRAKLGFTAKGPSEEGE